MALRFSIVAILFAQALGISGGLFAQPSSEPPNFNDRQIQARIGQLIAQLDDDRFNEREAASRELAEMGQAAKSALTAAAQSGSVEVRWRATVLLEQLRIAPASQVRGELMAFAAQPDESLIVEDGMWLLSRLLDPPSDKPAATKEDMTRQLDEMAAKVRERVGKSVAIDKVDPQTAIGALLDVLVDDYGLHGTANFSGDPAASTLDGLLTHKTGTPIGLGHVAIAVARRLELPIVGVPVMGMYLIKYDSSQAPAGFTQRDVYISPIDSFKILSSEALRELHHDPDDMPAPGSIRETLIRMLNNFDSSLARRDGPLDDLRRSLVDEFRTALENGPQVGE